MTTTATAGPAPARTDRLLSLDVFLGVTMFFLIGESTRIYQLLVDPALQGTFLAAVGTQFHHHAWNGMHVWDLIQPFFMFIVGVALPFFTIVGMNPLFIYLFTESNGSVWLASLVKPFTMAGQARMGQLPAEILTALAAWAMLWGMCYWLFRRKIIIRI